MKLIRCSRTITSYFTRTHLRTEAKFALKSDLKSKINFLATINFNDFSDYGKHGKTSEVYKSIAFQLGQTLALLNNNELYTKEGIATHYPMLEKYLKRIETDSIELQNHLDVFINRTNKLKI